jgi:hypothetical protein
MQLVGKGRDAWACGFLPECSVYFSTISGLDLILIPASLPVHSSFIPINDKSILLEAMSKYAEVSIHDYDILAIFKISDTTKHFVELIIRTDNDLDASSKVMLL